MSQNIKDSIVLLLLESKNLNKLTQQDVQDLCKLLAERWQGE
jgi:hypothetical protein